MSDFITVFSTDDHEEGEKPIIETEIIRTDDLLKVFKVDGNTGTGIGFLFYDRGRERFEDWRGECGCTYQRDNLFSMYERILCGIHSRNI